MTDIQPETMISSETVFDGKLIQVRRDTVALPGGGTTAREVVVHPEVVAILPVLPDGRLVFVRQFRYATGQTLLEAPAGGIEKDETPEQAARREMVEETGYRVGRLELLSSFYTSPGFVTEKMYLYKATELQAGEATEETDQIEVVALSVEEAERCRLRGEIVDAKSILALFFAREL